MARHVVENDADSLGIVLVDEIAHAFREVDAGPLIGDLCVAPRLVDVDKHEDVGSPVAHILVVETSSLARFGAHRHALFTDQLSWRFIEAHDRMPLVGRFGVQREYVLHASDILGVDLGDAAHLLQPRLELQLVEPTTNGLVGNRIVHRQADHLVSEKLHRPTRSAARRLGARHGDQ